MEAEYTVFTTNKVITMYRKRMAQMITEIKKATSGLDFCSTLANYTPPPPEAKNDLGSLAKKIKKELAEKNSEDKPSSPSKEGSQGTSSSSSVSELGKKKGGFRLKREKETQKKIKTFFKSAKTEKEAVNWFLKADFPVKEETTVPCEEEHDLSFLPCKVEIKEEETDSPLLPCPLCMVCFPLEELETHAASCQAEDEEEVEERSMVVEDEVDEDTLLDRGSTSNEEKLLSRESSLDKRSSQGKASFQGLNSPVVESSSRIPEQETHAMSSSDEEAEGPSSAFLDTRRKWQQKEAKSPTPAESCPFTADVEEVEDTDGPEMSSVNQEVQPVSSCNMDAKNDSDQVVLNSEADHNAEQSKLQKLLDNIKKDMEEKDAKQKLLEEEKRKAAKLELKQKIKDAQKQMPRRQDEKSMSKISLQKAHTPQKKISEARPEVKKHSTKDQDPGVKDHHADSRHKLKEKLKLRNKELKGKSEKQPKNGHSEVESKLQVADQVVKFLAPFLKSGSIACKATFKVLARELTHGVVRRGGSTGPQQVDEIVAKFFRGQEQPVREEQAKDLVRTFLKL